MKAKKKLPTKRDVEFLYEIGSLANVDRGWKQHLAMDCTNDLEHSFRVCWTALMIARMEGVGDESLILKMALTHDLAETRTADASYVQKVYVKADEDRAARDLFAKTLVEDFYGVIEKFEKRDSIEAKIVKDADNLDIDIELKELEERGSQLPKKWKTERKFIRDTKLYTESAKKLWDLIQKSDPSSWHRETNKWKLIPTAGK
jgi:5'-deoxynucleotidase YfbR-like HD superfamily hydrolase